MSINFFFFNSISNKKDCYKTCLTCSGSVDTECTSCTGSYYLYEGTGQCVPNCTIVNSQYYNNKVN